LQKKSPQGIAGTVSLIQLLFCLAENSVNYLGSLNALRISRMLNGNWILKHDMNTKKMPALERMLPQEKKF
jgi:hypothetical protein